MCNALMAMPTSSGVCADCWDKDEELFQKAKGAMKLGQKFLPEQLAGKTNIELKHIQRWAKQGRFG